MAARALPLRAGRHRAGERQGVSRQRLSLAPPGGHRGRDRAGADHRGGVAPAAPAARWPAGPAGAGARGVAGAVPATGTGWTSTGCRPAAREVGAWFVVAQSAKCDDLVDLSRTRVDVLACGRPEMAALALGLGVRLRAPALIGSLSPSHYRLALLRGDGRPHPAHPLRRHAAGGCRRFELMTLPYQDFAGFNASLGLLLEVGIERIRDHLPDPARGGAGQPHRHSGGLAPDRPGSGILCLAPDRVKTHRRLKAARVVCSLREGAIRPSRAPRPPAPSPSPCCTGAGSAGSRLRGDCR